MPNWIVSAPDGGSYSFSSREVARQFAREHGGLSAGYGLSEYGARIARGLSTGLSRTQARGHAPTYRGPAGGYLGREAGLTVSQRAALNRARAVQKEFERALTFKVNAQGKQVASTLADIAKKHRTTPDMVKRYVPDAGTKLMPVLEKGSLEVVQMPVPGINDRRLLSKYANELRRFQSTDPTISREAGKWLSKAHKIKLADGRIVILENDLERLRALSESGGLDFEFYSEVA